MEYVVGSVAALVSGNITPSRPRGLNRAATPVKHQPSPNITPKSELVDDRSIFLSPSTQKKKAIVKKSPKRIFQNPDLDVTDEKENLISPKADKVKKHLQDELSAEGTPSKAKKLHRKSTEPIAQVEPKQDVPKHSKKRKVSDSTEITLEKLDLSTNKEADNVEIKKKKKKSKKNKNQSEVIITQDKTATVADNIEVQQSEMNNTSQAIDKKKKKLKKSETYLGLNETESVKDNNETQDLEEANTSQDIGENKKIKKKLKKSKTNSHQIETESVKDNIETQDLEEANTSQDIGESTKKKRKLKKSKTNNSSSNAHPSKKIKVNPNAITNKDTDSEHESDNEIESENDDKHNELLQNDKSASEDEEEIKSNNLKPKKNISKEPTDTKEEDAVIHDPDEVNRTLFVGNVPFSKKCKKEIKKIFSVYGDIETVRIRSIPVKDPRFTPKLAVIRNELHPERSAVNVYVKYKQPESVQQALVENGRSMSTHTLRVSPCAAPSHDTARSVFVGNVPFASSDEELRAVFSPNGAVTSVRLVRDSHGVGKGFGYVNFESKDSVELALALTPEQRTLRNRELRVKRCALSQRDRDKQGGMRGSGQGATLGQGGIRGHGQREMRGHGQTGMRGYGQSEMRGRGQGGMRGRGQIGMRGRGQGGMRGRGQGGMPSRGGTNRVDDTRTAGEGADMQGALRRLEHKKKKSGGGGGGGGEFVGLTPDNKTKPKVKQSRQKKALAEIMSKT